MKLLHILESISNYDNAKIRDYTAKEYEEETHEYFKNDIAQKIAPNAFKDKLDMIRKIKEATPVILPMREIKKIYNSDVKEIIKVGKRGGKDAMLILAKELAHQYGKDWNSLEKSIIYNKPVPPPIALMDKNGAIYLLAGNTRLMIFTANAKKLPIKIINYHDYFNL